MATTWKEYQEEAAEFFRSLGFEAETDVTVGGVRTKHDIDVFVRTNHVAFDLTWVVECKHWQTPVNKLHVLGLRTIVSDIGADRGILLCEVGFQEGAREAASFTNVQVTTLAALSVATQDHLFALQLGELFDRVESCREEYWDLPKGVRIEAGLRPDVYESGYNGTHVIETAREVISQSLRGVFPIHSDPMMLFKFPGMPEVFAGPQQVVAFVEPMLVELEQKLAAARASSA